MSDNWYKTGLEEFNRRTGIHTQLANHLGSKQECFKLHTKERILSIGPGTGDVDVPLMTSYCPSLTHYIAVEPNGEESNVLKQRIKVDIRNPGLKVEIVEKTVESWTGPDEPVDVILMFHVLYHIPDPQALFQRCRQWLAPGGVMIIAHGGENIFYAIAEKYDVKEEKYVAKHILHDLAQLRFQDIKVNTLWSPFDIRDRNRDVMNFLLQKEATDKELMELDGFLKEVLPDGVGDQDFLWVISWTKP